jgi:nitroimidazol reductase NimA-like FMN-containing flavoprotein (pyridoxamine 5'-phosphate oxidase superfamily)
MFREIIRYKQALSDERCIEILKQTKRGVLSVYGTEGYPYGLPIDHWYCEENGKLYFHCGKTGHKLDALRQDPRVCYTVYGDGEAAEGEWALYFQSVIVFGEITFVEDEERIADICRQLSYKFTDDEHYIAEEIKGHLKGALHHVFRSNTYTDYSALVRRNGPFRKCRSCPRYCGYGRFWHKA